MRTILLVICLGTWALAIVVGRQLGALRVVRSTPGRKAAGVPPQTQTRQIPFWVLPAVVVCAVVIGRVVPREIVELMTFGVAMLLPLAFLSWIGVTRWRWRGQQRVLRRASEGDPEGAIRSVREEIEFRGPTAERWATLGCLLGQQQRWEEALSAFEQADCLSDGQPVYQSNRALALLKTGRSEEALILLDEAIPKMHDTVTARCTRFRALAALGRWDEAREELSTTEDLLQSGWYSKAEREVLRGQIAACRQVLEELSVPPAP